MREELKSFCATLELQCTDDKDREFMVALTIMKDFVYESQDQELREEIKVIMSSCTSVSKAIDKLKEKGYIVYVRQS